MRPDIRHFIIALVAALFVGIGIALAGQLVGQRRGGFITLSLTPQIIGQNTGREELIIENLSDSANAAFCCWSNNPTPCVPNRTPGADTGTFVKNAGGGADICKYPDQVLSCISAGANLSYDQAYARTTTPSATPTITPTP